VVKEKRAGSKDPATENSRYTETLTLAIAHRQHPAYGILYSPLLMD